MKILREISYKLISIKFERINIIQSKFSVIKSNSVMKLVKKQYLEIVKHIFK